MEFSFAANGNVAALREWLLAHPDRVNVPSAGPQCTLLFTAVSSGRLPIVTLLLNEFNADPSIPCGGMGNTAVHAAALSGNVAVLEVLLSRSVTMRPNHYNEYPIDVAEMDQPDKTPLMKEYCIAMLRAYAAQNKNSLPKLQQSGRDLSLKRVWSSPVVGLPLPIFSGMSGQIRDTIREVQVISDDERSNGHKLSSHSTPVKKDIQGFFPDEMRLETPLGEANIFIPRSERILSGVDRLPMDLVAFRRAFGNAFEFVETSHTLQVEGLLPYQFKAVLYYTPVILIIDKNVAGRTPSRYRALINRKRLDNLYINRRATYIDPCTGAIIPSDTDAWYGGLLEFVEEAIIRNFELIPPLTEQKDGGRGVQVNEPLFSRQMSEHDTRFRILRQLSMFCDEGIGYDSAKKIASVFVPIFSIGKRSINRIENSNMRSNNSANVSDGTDPLKVLSADFLMKIPVQMRFIPCGDFSEPPRVYLINATNKTAETRMNFAFLRKLIIDSTSGEVHRSCLTALTEWSEHGSLCAILKELQMKMTYLLVDYVKNNSTDGPIKDSSNLNKGKQLDSGTRSSVAEDATNDWLLITSVTSSTPTVRSSVGSSSFRSRVPYDESNKCVVCLVGDKTVLLMPCRHVTLCRMCSQMYKDRLRDNMLCPCCRAPIKEFIDVLF